MRAIAYLRVSTEEQATSGLGLDAQREVVVAEIDRKGWELLEVVVDDGYSAKDLRRPGIARAIRMLDAGMADAIVVSKIDRLSRSMLDFAGLMDSSRRRGWEMVALDLGVDTSTPQGEMMASVMQAFAQFERHLIGARTSDALQALKRRGQRLGRPVELETKVRDRIVRMRDQGMTLRAIADELTDEGVATAQGGRRWYHSTVSKVLRSIEVDQEMAEIRARAAA